MIIPRLPFLAVGIPLFGRKLIARNIDVVVLERANDRSRRREQNPPNKQDELRWDVWLATRRRSALALVHWCGLIFPALASRVACRASTSAEPSRKPPGSHRPFGRAKVPITMNMLHDTDAWNFCRWRRSSATRLVRLRRGVQRLAGRKPERLPTPHALAAIALQVQQSLWRSCISGPLDHEGAHAPSRRRQTCSGRTSSTGLQSLHAEKAS